MKKTKFKKKMSCYVDLTHSCHFSIILIVFYLDFDKYT